MTMDPERDSCTQGTARRWVGGSHDEAQTRLGRLNLLNEHPFRQRKELCGIHDNLASPTREQVGSFFKKTVPLPVK